jgi:phosphate starvation-inducible protein PhoH
MRGRKSKPSKAMKDQAEAIKEQIERRGEEFGRRAEAVVDALGDAVDRIQDLSTTTGRRASKRGRAATRRSVDAAREALDQARNAARQVPDWDQMADLARRTGDRLMPERARQRRKAERRRRVRLAAGGIGLAGVGAAVLAWLGAGRRGSATARGEASEGAGYGEDPGGHAPRSAATTPSGSTTKPRHSEDLNVSGQPTGSGNGHTGPGTDA